MSWEALERRLLALLGAAMLENPIIGYGKHLMVFDCEADMEQDFTDGLLTDLEGPSDRAMPFTCTHRIVSVSVACTVHIQPRCGMIYTERVSRLS